MPVCLKISPLSSRLQRSHAQLNPFEYGNFSTTRLNRTDLLYLHVKYLADFFLGLTTRQLRLDRIVHTLRNDIGVKRALAADHADSLASPAGKVVTDGLGCQVVWRVRSWHDFRRRQAWIGRAKLPLNTCWLI